MPETRNQETAPPRPAAYAPLDSTNLFELPCGRIARMSDIVELDPVHGGVDQAIRYQEEVRLIQRAIGATPDGKIGIETRTAARDVSTRYKRDVVKDAFVKLWMEAFNLGQEARDAGLPAAVHAVCAYMHNMLCIAHCDLKGEEHLHLSANTKRPVFIKLENLAAPVMRSADPNVVMEPKVDLGAALQRIEIARMREALEWLRNHPDASWDRKNAVIQRGLDRSLP